MQLQRSSKERVYIAYSRCIFVDHPQPMFDKYISLNFFPTTPFSIDVFTGGQQLVLKLNDFIVVF